MKKQTWNRVGVLLLCLMLFIPTCGLTDNFVSDNLYRFKLSVVDKQEQTSFLTVWDNVGKQQLIELISDHHLCDTSSEVTELSATWHTPAHGIQYAFEQAWGSKLHWTLQQNHEYALFEIECGISQSTVVALPMLGDMPVDEARTYVQEAIRNQASDKQYEFNGKFEAYIERVQFWRYPDYGSVWVFEYYGDSSITPELSGMIYLDTLNITVEIHDNLDMQYLYRQKCFENGFQPYKCWSLDEQAEFYRQLVALKEHQLMVYGFIPSFAETILSYEHVLPSDDMLSMTDAEKLAKEAVSYLIDDENATTSDFFIGASLIRTTEDKIAYCFYLELPDKAQEKIAVDAYSGKIIDLDLSLSRD